MRTYALEMMLATLMVACGLCLVWPGQTFALPHYALMKGWMQEEPGGVLLVLAGAVRWRAILTNGDSDYSPLWRVGGCCVGGGFWLTLALGVGVETVTEPEVVTYGPPLMLAVAVTAFIFEIFAGMRGGADAHFYDSLGLRAARQADKGGANAGHP